MRRPFENPIRGTTIVDDLSDGAFEWEEDVGQCNTVKAKLLAAGFRLKQDAATEGMLLFDPANAAQAKFALRAARVREIREATPGMLAALAKATESRQAALALA